MFAFDNSYARLPERFYARVLPTRVASPRLVRLNRPLVELLGGDAGELASPGGVQVLAGNAVPPGAEPLAMAYAGHQFGGFVPRLGDGRAILMGEVVGADGQRRDVQWKGCGPTPFSRGGDGRAALGPVLREYLVSEAMTALGVPSTRALAAVTTGERVLREQGPLPGAVLVRVAASHLRVGTFEYFAARRDHEALTTLVTYALARHYPDRAGEEHPALALLEGVVAAQARLVAAWLGLGFIHGVMNTDNTSISGETIDFGPCAFLDEYRPDKRFSSIDHHGRYAYANQPRIALWNLSRLAETLLPLIATDEAAAVRAATERLERFPELFGAAHEAVLRRKLGLGRPEPDDQALIQDLLERLAGDEVDFTLFFRRLCDATADASADGPITALFRSSDAPVPWLERWRRRLASEPLDPRACADVMRRHSPAFIPRNHRIEEAIDAAVHQADFGPFERLLRALERPFEDQPELAELATPPAPHERVCATFCGT